MLAAMKSVGRDRREMAAVVIVGVLVGTMSAIPLWRLTDPSSVSDILRHAAIAVELVESGSAFSYSLWYPLIWLFTAGGDPALFRISSVMLLSSFVVLKSLLIYLIARERRVDVGTSSALAFGLSFVAPLIDPNAPNDIYLGQVSATVWHNSTNIMVAPFAVLAFWLFVRLAEDRNGRTATMAGLAIAASVLVKPNFAIALLPVAGVFLVLSAVLGRDSWRRAAAILGLALGPAVVTLMVQYILIYTGDDARSAGLVIRPFEVWSAQTDNLPLSLALSFGALGAAVLALLVGRSLSVGSAIALLVLCTAVVQFVLLAELASEAGNVAESANWAWGSHTALLVAVLWVVLDLVQGLERRGDNGQRRWLVAGLALMGLHVVSGVYYALVVGTVAYGNY